MQQQAHLNHDVGWILHSARWMLEGRRFGSDIVDPNPPLIWFLSMPAAVLVNAGWVGEPEAIRGYVWMLCLVSMALCHKLLAPLRRSNGESESVVLIIVLVFVIALLPGRSFAQREFLCFVLGMPYCLLVAGRMLVPAAYSRRVSVVCGLFAGVGFGLKPWLLAVPLLVELAYLLHTRSWARLFRGETMSMGGILAAYVLAAFLFTPDYFSHALPLARAVYWIYGHSDPALMWADVRDFVAPVIVCAAALSAIARTSSPHTRVLFAAAVGYLANYWMQGKGFEYHLYPALATSVVLVALTLLQASRMFMGVASIRKELRVSVIATAVLVVCVHVWPSVQHTRLWFIREGTYSGWMWQMREGVIQRVRQITHGQHKTIYAFSTHPFPGFPTVTYANVEWGGRQLAQFALAGLIREQQIRGPEALERMRRGIERQRQTVVEEFLAQDPDIVLINSLTLLRLEDSARFDYIAYFSSDPRFAERWRYYHEVKGSNAIRFFVKGARQ